MIRSLETTVVPAIDPGHPLALEQADLIVKTLHMLRSQLPQRRAKALRELDRYTTLTEEVRTVAEWPPEIMTRVDESLRAARSVRESTSAECVEIDEVTASLATAVSDIVRTARTSDVDVRRSVDRTILDASQPLLDDELSWFASQGWSNSSPHN
ncbi:MULTISPECIES: hypothetical protein [unclassified Rhodococcus (in: high G+C Gram-positive bacteria)]|uniref:hypothetical protein n=1 Tax=unclassified Rhodococcus (in: high G+C Gram-positive bacteria) TaxID=192944 RepID=UPI0016399DF2|nr:MULTISPECIES: hypothetical protein [unclassified Rhodococcus (in: high G+C Gram-positive bacteria)]MBC2637640.1 hypothetical protein [Rhodococcus sp. 3A]MBC2897616.1 hypothetical protein [Rhodococcus sp. 4CII]